MKNKLKIFFGATILSVFAVISSQVALAQPAEPILVVNPLTPIFTITNALPGGEYISDEITVTNNGTEAQDVQFSVVVKTNPQNLMELLYMQARDEGGACLANCSFADNLNKTTEIFIGTLGSGDSKKYKFAILFDKSADNQFQKAEMIFDLQIGYRGEELARSEEDDGDDEDDEDGENNEDEGILGGSLTGNPIISSVANFLSGGEDLFSGGEVSGAEIISEEEKAYRTEAGEIKGAIKNCVEWPGWVWILLAVIYVALFNYSSYRKKEERKIRWIMPALETLIILAVWYFFERCRLYPWYPYVIVVLALVSYFIYLTWLRKKNKKPRIALNLD